MNHSNYLRNFVDDTKSRYYANVISRKGLEQIEAETMESLNKFRKEILYTECENIVLSFEGAYAFENYQLERLSTLLIGLAPNSNQVYILVTRNLDDYIASFKQEFLKHGFTLKEDFVEKFYNQSIIKFSNVLKDISLKHTLIEYKFEDSVRHHYGPIGQFFDEVGLNVDLPIDIEKYRMNDGISNKSAEIIEFINDYFGLRIDQNLNVVGEYSRIRNNGDINPLLQISGDKFKLSKKEYDLIGDLCKEKVDIFDYYIKQFDEKKFKNYNGNMKYDDLYYEDFIKALERLPRYLIKLCFDFIEQKNIKNVDGRRIIKKLERFFLKNYSFVTNMSIFELYDEDYKIKNKYKEQYNEFVTKFVNETNASPELFYSHLSLVCEEHGLIGAAKNFIRIAKIFEPSSEYLNKKDEDLKKW